MSELLLRLREEFEVARAENQARRVAGDRYRSMAERTAFDRWFRLACAEGTPPDSLDPRIEDEYLRFMSYTVQGPDGHVFWTGPQRFPLNDGSVAAPRRWWWGRVIEVVVSGERLILRPVCGDQHCIHPHHQTRVSWAEHRRVFTNDSIIGSIQVLAMRLGHSPTTEQWIEAKMSPTLTVVRARFGTWSLAVAAAGLSPADQPSRFKQLWSRERLLEELRAWHAREGFVPSGRWWYANVSSPSYHTIMRRFKSWPLAWREALR